MTERVLWRRLDLPGHEAARLDRIEQGWELSGTAIFSHDRRPCILNYLVVCDAAWRTTSARVAGEIGDREVDLSVAVDERRRWRLNGEDRPQVDGCIDIDLGFSPATNLLPIRRLSLAIGERAAVEAAWLPFPGLEFEPLSQEYRRQEENVYRYESAGGRFVRVLEVDHVGLVVDYPGLWRKEAE